MANLPPRLQEIIEDFQLSEGREKLELLLEFSERMPPLPKWLQERRADMEPVPECMTPISVHTEIKQKNGTRSMSFYFDCPPESPTVRGFAAIIAEGLEGASPQEVLEIPGDFYLEMGLDQVLSSQRLNGISAILAHVKRLAVQAITA